MGAGPTARKEEGKSIDMSGKTAKKNRKEQMKVMNGTADPKETADEQAKSIRHMIEERDKKATNAKKHLIAQLDVTIDKYRTANGVMTALQTVRAVAGDHSDLTLEDEIGMAKAVATEMARVTAEMADNAEKTDPDNLDELCDGFYNKEFSENDSSAIEMVHELMILQLCQNVGPDADDVANFCKQADEEIEKARENLRKFCEENELDFLEVVGEK